MKNEMKFHDQQKIEVGSIISLRSDQGILGTVLEKMNEDDDAKYKILINGRTLTIPESRINLVKSEVDDKVLDKLESEHIGSTQEIVTIDSNKEPNEEPLRRLSGNQKETILKPTATKSSFSFSKNISHVIDKSCLQSSECNTCRDFENEESIDRLSSSLEEIPENDALKLIIQNPNRNTYYKSQNTIVHSNVNSTVEIGVFNYSRNIALSISIWVVFNLLLGIIIENL